jgi:flagellar basal-body rod protein FlgB
MSEIDPVMGGVTSQLVSIALDASLTRHATIAANIANVDTPDYRPMTTRFDQLVTELQGHVIERTNDAATARTVEQMRDSLQSLPVVPDPATARVELDMQMAALAKNTLQYQALLTAQGKLGELMQLVIGEGKT